MLPQKQVSRATYNRNVKSGKWLAVSPPKDATALIQVVKATRGVNNRAGRMFLVSFIEPKKTQE